MNRVVFMLSTLLTVNVLHAQQAPTKPISPSPNKPQVVAPSKPTVEPAQIKMGESGEALNPVKSFQDGNGSVSVKIPNPSSTSDILRRLASAEVLIAKLERRVADLEAKQKANEAHSGK